MKKFMNFVLMAVLAVCFVLPAAGKAEAAKLAVVPLANHVEDNTTASMIYMEEILERIASETGADIVIAMSLDKLDDKILFPRREPTLQLDMSGEFAFLNKVTGRYYTKKYSSDMEIEEALTVRSDWKSEEFAKTVRSYLKKVDQIK